MRIKIKQVDWPEIWLVLHRWAEVKRALIIAGIDLDREVIRNGEQLSLSDTLKQGDILYIPPKKITSDK